MELNWRPEHNFTHLWTPAFDKEARNEHWTASSTNDGQTECLDLKDSK